MNNKILSKTISIRIPYLISNLLSAEAIKRNFLKDNGKENENNFLNKLLPNMIKYREQKKDSLRDFLDKNIKMTIKKGMENTVVECLTDYFDYLYFDKEESSCDDMLNFRINISNEELFTNLFDRLDSMNIKRSSYLKNLIYEYLDKSEYQKDRICFKNEYENLLMCMQNSQLCQLNFDKTSVIAQIVAVEFSVKHEHWYVLYFENNDFSKIYSAPIYKIKNVLVRNKPAFLPPDDISDKIYKIIEQELYDQSDYFNFNEEI